MYTLLGFLRSERESNSLAQSCSLRPNHSDIRPKYPWTALSSQSRASGFRCIPPNKYSRATYFRFFALPFLSFSRFHLWFASDWLTAIYTRGAFTHTRLRRGRDSNPRSLSRLISLATSHIRPLCHLSIFACLSTLSVFAWNSFLLIIPPRFMHSYHHNSFLGAIC